MSERSTLREYTQVLRRRKWIVVQAVVIVTVVAVVLSMLQPARYSASAEVLLSRQNLPNALNGVTDPSLTIDPQRLVETQVSVAQTPQIAENVVRAAHLPRHTAGELLASSSVTAKTDADVLVFHVSDGSPTAAAKLATLYAEKYVAYANQLSTRAIRGARAQLEAKIAQLRASGSAKGSYFGELVAKEQQLATMEALATGNAILLKRADGATQTQPRPVRNGLLGLLVGLVLGVGLAFVVDHFDTRVRSAGEVSQRLGLPLLARLPEPPRELRRYNELVMMEWPTSPHAEPFRVLATNLDFVAPEGTPKTIMVSSAREGEGKSTTAANLAVALARAGRRVALVDLDLRRPFLHTLFQVPQSPGLTNLVVGRTTLERALVPVQIPDALGARAAVAVDPDRLPTRRLEVMPSGPIPPNPGEFVRARGISRVLSELAEIFDTVVVDSAPLLGVGDSLALIPRVDALIVVARLELLRRPVLNELQRVLEGSPAKPLGIVVTAAEREEGEGYGQAYGYGYGYGYGSPNGSGASSAASTDRAEARWRS